MTLDELLQLARRISDTRAYLAGGDADTLARGILDLLGEAFPCGFTPPCATSLGVFVSLDGDTALSPVETRTFAAAMLRAANEAEAKHG